MRKLFDYLRYSATAADMAWKVFTFLVVAGGGTTAGVLASSSQWFGALGPVAWLGVAILAGLGIATIFALVRISQRAAAEAALATAIASKATTVNPVLGSFEDAVIPIAALQLPGKQLHKHKQFRRCKFVGPGALVLAGGTFSRSTFHDVGDVLTFPSDTMLSGVTVLESCIVEDCEFYGVCLIIPRQFAASFKNLPGARVAL
jgi:hypothetical protein